MFPIVTERRVPPQIALGSRKHFQNDSADKMLFSSPIVRKIRYDLFLYISFYPHNCCCIGVVVTMGRVYVDGKIVMLNSSESWVGAGGPVSSDAVVLESTDCSLLLFIWS